MNLCLILKIQIRVKCSFPSLTDANDPHKKKHVLSDYWSQSKLTETASFSLYIWHVNTSTTSCVFYILIENYRIWKIWSLFDKVKNKITGMSNPFQKLVIDDSLFLFKGWTLVKQYIPSKWHCFCLKLFVMCDCTTWSWTWSATLLVMLTFSFTISLSLSSTPHQHGGGVGTMVGGRRNWILSSPPPHWARPETT